MKKYKNTIIKTLLLTAVVLGFNYIVLTKYLDSAGEKTSSSPTETKEQNVSKKDERYVNELTNELLKNFEKDQKRTLEELTTITNDYMSKDFYENVYTVPYEQERWLGMFGLGVFYVKELKREEGSMLGTEIDYVTGQIDNWEIADIQKDQKNNTITTYIRYDGINMNQKKWIEWRDIPNEGWKINAVSFHAHIDNLETPISPKKEW